MRRFYGFAQLLERIPAGYLVDAHNKEIWHKIDGFICRVDFEYDVARQHEWAITKYNGWIIKGTLQEVVDKVCAMHRIGVTNYGSSQI